jgi:hypothetical protein
MVADPAAGAMNESAMRPRGIWERYNEQVAEDTLRDMVETAYLVAQDGARGRGGNQFQR